MDKQTDTQLNIENQIEQAFSVALFEVNNLCPNVDCKSCEYASDCIATYRNRMKAMFLKGCIQATSHLHHHSIYEELLNNMTNHG